jgi:hypothetical protein
MRKNLITVQRRRDEAKATLEGFTAVNVEKYNAIGGYSYTSGYLHSILVNVLSQSVSEEVFKQVMDQIRQQTVDNFVKG